MIAKVLCTLATVVSSTLAATFQVTVGISQTNGQVGPGFDPDRIVPAAGDTVIFSFGIPSYIQNAATGTYDVTQGIGASPCQPLSGGFSTGPQTTVPGDGNGPQYTLAINDTTPLYFYSSQAGQCAQGMALGVNTPAQGDGSIDGYIAAAASAGGGGGSATQSNAPSSAASSSATRAASSASRSSAFSASSVRSASASSSTFASAPAASSSGSTSTSGANAAGMSTAIVAFVGLAGAVFRTI